MADPATLAAYIVGTFLVPYASKGAEKIGEAVAKKFGEEIGSDLVKRSKRLWEVVKGAFSGDEITKLDLFEGQPEEYRNEIEATLKRKIKNDARLKTELEEIVEKPAGNGDSGYAIMHATYAVQMDLRYGTYSGGHIQNTGMNIQMGGSPQAPAERSGRPDTKTDQEIS